MTNSKYLLLTGRKAQEKVYYRHSGKPGHLKVTPVPLMIEKKVNVNGNSRRLRVGNGRDFEESGFGDVTEE